MMLFGGPLPLCDGTLIYNRWSCPTRNCQRPQGRTQIHHSTGTDINVAFTRAGPTGSRALTRRPTSIREWPCESRLLCSDPKRISSPHWVNLVMPRRGSIPLGVSGCIGYLNINEHSPTGVKTLNLIAEAWTQTRQGTRHGRINHLFIGKDSRVRATCRVYGNT